ncbi:hypothetical protein GQ602_004820 [Ophiocordyceps camponoti-floridani]|uniref:Secreted protein n=1 Tax=Ophiocordyceps camponoti-floridani TaxID=2030778 RepID=A0A8H4Q4I6_9HYPO|nr:hypothetical protein GQ602_004820 [Ophiocordyceps camponoti-floridani]
MCVFLLFLTSRLPRSIPCLTASPRRGSTLVALGAVPRSSVHPAPLDAPTPCKCPSCPAPAIVTSLFAADGCSSRRFGADRGKSQAIYNPHTALRHGAAWSCG